MASINYTNYNIDQTVRVFDSFYDYDVDIPVGDYDVVNSYFQSVMTTKQAADNFTVSLFRVAQDTNIPPLTLLQTFQASGEQLDLNINMAYYLNSISSRATLLGVGIPVAPNYYAARNVVQQWHTGRKAHTLWSTVPSMWATVNRATDPVGNSVS